MRNTPKTNTSTTAPAPRQKYWSTITVTKARPARPGSNSPCQFQTTSTEYLSRLLPDFSFETPSPDAVLSLYRFVVSQAVELDGALRGVEESRAEVERKDIELDQALQDRESTVSPLETQVKSLQEELAKVKGERNTFGKSVATLLGGYSS
jgi:nucleoprotein TPR